MDNKDMYIDMVLKTDTDLSTLIKKSEKLKESYSLSNTPLTKIFRIDSRTPLTKRKRRKIGKAPSKLNTPPPPPQNHQQYSRNEVGTTHLDYPSPLPNSSSPSSLSLLSLLSSTSSATPHTHTHSH